MSALTRRSFVPVCTLFCLAVLMLFRTAARAQSFDPVADFDAGFTNGVNPNGVWTYGWTPTLTGTLTVYPDHRTIQPDCDPINAWDDLNNNASFTPLTYKSTAACNNGNVDYPAGALILHGGGQSGLDYSHVLFTAPAAGGYAIAITFTGRQHNINADAHVLKNGVSLFDTTITSDGQAAPFSATVSLNAGDTIDFTVGQNNTTPIHPGSVQLSGTIGVVPVPVLTSIKPSSANAGASGLTLTVAGSSFVNGDTVQWKRGTTTTPLTTTFVSATKLTASVPASLLASPGKATVNVLRVGGATSAASKTFTVLVTTLSLVSATLSRDSTTGAYTATITLKNTGNMSAPSVSLTKSSLGAAPTSTTLPVSLSSLAAGASTSTSLTFPGSAGSPGAKVTLKASGKFTGGTFSGSLKVTLPQ